MQQRLQEFVQSSGESIRVDRHHGVLRGVKLLGLASRNGRTYREAALAEAAALYEGAKVNVNHPKGSPLAPRDYQDRLGAIRGVKFRPGEGLFADLYFNPKHPLAEQLMWDANHSPGQVGLSHNVLARTRRDGDTTVVEAITRVESVDLVADPATTCGLFEHQAAADERLQPLTHDVLRGEHPEIVEAIEKPLREQLQAAALREAKLQRQVRIMELLAEHGLPLPGSNDAARAVTPEFLETLTEAASDELVEARIADRAAVVNAEASRLRPQATSQEQQTVYGRRELAPAETAADFAAALRR